MIDTFSLTIINEAPQNEHCRYLIVDERGPRCSSSSLPDEDSRRAVTDSASLQLYCLNPEQHTRCIFYRQS